jgi:molecular chaperone GrpE
MQGAMAAKRDDEHDHQQGRPERRGARVADNDPEGARREAPDQEPSGQGPEAEQADPRPEHQSQDQQDQSQQLEEARARHLRLAADFENFRKRVRQEQLETIQHAAATLAERLLPVLDDAQRALEHVPEGTDEGWLRGVRLTFQHLEEALAAVGVEAIEAVGRPFDPKLHEAIGSEESDQYPDDTVLMELRRGYRMHERVLRPALVKVSRQPVAGGLDG